MCTNPKQNSQRGRAMTEFVAAADGAFHSLIMGVIYVLQVRRHSRHQASKPSRLRGHGARARPTGPREHRQPCRRNATVAPLLSRNGAQHPIARDEAGARRNPPAMRIRTGVN